MMSDAWEARIQRHNELYKPLIERIPDGWGRQIAIGEGWSDLVLTLDREIAALDPNYKLHQCKEKFGGLRYYIEHYHNDACAFDEDPQYPDDGYWHPKCKIEKLVSEAEKKSYEICEVCGEPGSMMGDGYAVTLCLVHAEERRRTRG